MRAYINFLDRYKYIIVATITLITLLLSISLKDIEFEGSYRVWFNKESKVIKDYDNFREKFGSDEIFVIAFKDKDGVFNKKAISTIKNLTLDIKKIDGIKRVDSLATYPDLNLSKDLNAQKQKALKDSFLINRLLSEDAKSTAIVVSLQDKSKIKDLNIYVFKKLKKLIKSYEKSTGYKLYLTGVPAVTASLVEVAKSDALKLMPLAVVIVVALLALLFRSFMGIIVPSVVIVFTFLIVLSVQILLGYKLNNFTVNIPAFISAISIASSLHLYMAWIFYKQKESSTKEALYLALSTNFKPIAMTSLTTAIGFATLAFSKIEPISTLGIAISLGAVLAFIFTITLAPAIILTIKDNYKAKPVSFINFVNIKGYGAFIAKHNKAILAIFTILIALGIYGIKYLKVDSNSIKYFAQDTVVRSGSNFLQNNITGSFVYEVIVDSKSKDGIYNPEFINKIKEFKTALKKQKQEVRAISSIVDIIEAIHAKSPNRNKPISSKEELKSYINYYKKSKNSHLFELVDKNQRYLRVTINTNSQPTSKDLKLIKFIENWWQKTKYSATVEGQTTIFTYMQRDVTKTLVNSILATLAIVMLAMLFFFKSFKALLLFIIPNLAPLALVAGVMGYLGINIDIGVSISAAVILGIAVDDTIHFFSKFFEAIKTKSFEESIDYVLSYSGNAMILTTLILSFTFLVFSVSSFIPNVHFAIVTIVALNIALLLDLVLVPALLSFFYGKGKNVV